MDYFNVKTYDTWEGNVTIKSEIQTKNIRSLGFWNIIGGVTLRGVDITETKIPPF
jgi:hypothetical protein